MNISFFEKVWQQRLQDISVIVNRVEYSYADLIASLEKSRKLVAKHIRAGEVVSLEAEFSRDSITMFLALIEKNAIIVPISSRVSRAKREEFLQVGLVEKRIIHLEDAAPLRFEPTQSMTSHAYYDQLRHKNHPGLVLFSSGSTGKSKAAVHDFSPLLQKYANGGRTARILSFLLFDHIGGINTLFHTLASGGTVVIPGVDRQVEDVCKLIERHRVEILPTSPTFITLLIMSEIYKKYDLSSLKLVTYGTEVMNDTILKKFHALFPNVRLLQTYGLSELGILKTRSEANDSLWVKVGGDGYETRIVDGLLEIKATSAMLGYLNAESPFTKDGWFQTGDAVEVKGDYLKILGRQSELINVGGQKVYPAEVESILLQMEGVTDVVVKGEPHPILGHIVTATIQTFLPSVKNSEMRRRIFQFCQDKLEPFKIPQKVQVHKHMLHNERYKKVRK